MSGFVVSQNEERAKALLEGDQPQNEDMKKWVKNIYTDFLSDPGKGSQLPPDPHFF